MSEMLAVPVLLAAAYLAVRSAEAMLERRDRRRRGRYAIVRYDAGVDTWVARRGRGA